MKLVRYAQPDGTDALGVLSGQGILDLAATAKQAGISFPERPDAFFALGLKALPALHAVTNVSSGVLLNPDRPLLSPLALSSVGKVICIGLNYRRHAEETGAPIPTSPIVFSKFGSALAGPNDPIPLPRLAVQADYEAELVVVIGKRARYVAEAEALSYVLGYTIGNDVSARDLQLRTSQWLLGKTPDKFLPIGPWLVTSDEVPDPQELGIRGWLNTELRQTSSTADMIFTVAQIIAYLSQFFPLEPGDIIATGTPQGVILGLKEKVWLKPGDTYAIEIDGLGRLENTFVEEPV